MCVRGSREPLCVKHSNPLLIIMQAQVATMDWGGNVGSFQAYPHNPGRAIGTTEEYYDVQAPVMGSAYVPYLNEGRGALYPVSWSSGTATHATRQNSAVFSFNPSDRTKKGGVYAAVNGLSLPEWMEEPKYAFEGRMRARALMQAMQFKGVADADSSPDAPNGTRVCFSGALSMSLPTTKKDEEDFVVFPAGSFVSPSIPWPNPDYKPNSGRELDDFKRSAIEEIETPLVAEGGDVCPVWGPADRTGRKEARECAIDVMELATYGENREGLQTKVSTDLPCMTAAIVDLLLMMATDKSIATIKAAMTKDIKEVGETEAEKMQNKHIGICMALKQVGTDKLTEIFAAIIGLARTVEQATVQVELLDEGGKAGGAARVLLPAQ